MVESVQAGVANRQVKLVGAWVIFKVCGERGRVGSQINGKHRAASNLRELCEECVKCHGAVVDVLERKVTKRSRRLDVIMQRSKVPKDYAVDVVYGMSAFEANK